MTSQLPLDFNPAHYVAFVHLCLCRSVSHRFISRQHFGCNVCDVIVDIRLAMHPSNCRELSYLWLQAIGENILTQIYCKKCSYMVIFLEQQSCILACTCPLNHTRVFVKLSLTLSCMVLLCYNFIFLLCLTPDDFTFQGKSPRKIMHYNHHSKSAFSYIATKHCSTSLATANLNIKPWREFYIQNWFIWCM